LTHEVERKSAKLKDGADINKYKDNKARQPKNRQTKKTASGTGTMAQAFANLKK